MPNFCGYPDGPCSLAEGEHKNHPGTDRDYDVNGKKLHLGSPLKRRRPPAFQRERVAEVESKTGRILRGKETVKPIRVEPTDGHVAVIKHSIGLKLAMGFNSLVVDVGIEMPMPTKPGDLQAAVRHMARIEKLIESRFEGKAAEMKSLLKALARERK
jgi:hypothetical protein